MRKNFHVKQALPRCRTFLRNASTTNPVRKRELGPPGHERFARKWSCAPFLDKSAYWGQQDGEGVCTSYPEVATKSLRPQSQRQSPSGKKGAQHRHGQRTRPVGLTEQWDWPGATASPVRVCKRATCPVQVADSVRVTGSPNKNEPTAVHCPWRRHRDHSANADHNVKFRMGIPGVTWDEGIFIRVCWIVVALRS